MDRHQITVIVDLINARFDQKRTPMEVFGDVKERYPDISVRIFWMILATMIEELRLDIEEDKANLAGVAGILFTREKAAVPNAKTRPLQGPA